MLCVCVGDVMDVVFFVCIVRQMFCLSHPDAVGSAWLFIVRSRLLVYSAGSGVNRVQVVRSGFSKSLFCCVQENTLCRYGCMHFLVALVLVCVM